MRECVDAGIKYFSHSDIFIEHDAHLKRNRQDNQIIRIQAVDQTPTIEKCQENKSFTPLLLVNEKARQMWVYGCVKENAKLTELAFDDAIFKQFQNMTNHISYAERFTSEFFKMTFELLKSNDRNFRYNNSDPIIRKTPGIFQQIRSHGAHEFRRAEGSTAIMTHLLHRLPVNNADVRLPQDEDVWHQTAQFFGAERVYDFILSKKKKDVRVTISNDACGVKPEI
jgi:hypothetical protein